MSIELYNSLLLDLKTEGRNRRVCLKLKDSKREVVQYKLEHIVDNFFQFEDCPFLFRNKIPSVMKDISPDIYIDTFNGVIELLQAEGSILIETFGTSQYSHDLPHVVMEALLREHPHPASAVFWWPEYCKAAWIPLSEGYRVMFSNCYDYARLECEGERLGSFRQYWKLDFNGDKVPSEIVEEGKKAIMKDGGWIKA